MYDLRVFNYAWFTTACGDSASFSATKINL